MRRGLVAFGGNALIKANEKGTIHEQIANAAEAARALVPMLGSYSHMMFVHGNGPQVGQNLIRVEEAVTKVPPLPLDVCVAETQGSMGYIIEKAFSNELQLHGDGRDLLSVLTQVEVDAEDPAFRNPTKPIGPFYTAYRAKHLMEVERWAMVEDSGRGYRKVVASPKPKRILGIGALKALYNTGALITAGGGGGIPVVRQLDGTHKGVEAVIDKDRTSVLLACELEVDDLIFLTSVPCIYVDFGKPSQKALGVVSLEEILEYQKQGQFPPGSMGPKVEAAVQFLVRQGGSVVLTDAANLKEAVLGKAGTRIVHEKKKTEDQGSLPCTVKISSRSRT
ncbi:MAG: carbamate kinase [Acidobacteria bacterium]|jgi:carbamate kinase|nr:carbamate kinase [Acidobacteriota bacterium]